jgi:hypothetical protein
MSDKAAVMDYSTAVASAVAWLGHRYLLARPARRLTPEERRSANLTVPDDAGRQTFGSLLRK